MSTDIQNETSQTSRPRHRGGWVAGVVLILIGLLLLVGQFVKSEWLGLLFLPALGLVFLVWGSVTRRVGLLIPGGILGGIGLGALLLEGPFSTLNDPARGGVFLISFALGWGVITLLSAITGRVHWWPLIPGSIMAVTGGALLVSETTPQALTVINAIWPIALIALGLYIILRRRE